MNDQKQFDPNQNSPEINQAPPARGKKRRNEIEFDVVTIAVIIIIVVILMFAL